MYWKVQVEIFLGTLIFTCNRKHSSDRLGYLNLILPFDLKFLNCIEFYLLYHNSILITLRLTLNPCLTINLFVYMNIYTFLLFLKDRFLYMKLLSQSILFSDYILNNKLCTIIWKSQRVKVSQSSSLPRKSSKTSTIPWF